MSEPIKKLDVCPHCMPEGKTVTPRSKPFGDFIILRPDRESAERLAELGLVVQDVLDQTLETDENAFRPYTARHMHLTVASPLKALTQEQARELMNKVQRDLLSQRVGKLQFDLEFSSPTTTRAYDFNLGGRTYAPHVTVRLIKPAGAEEHEPSDALSTVAQTVMKSVTASTEELLDPTSDAFRKYNPHFTLGRATSREIAKCLHHRERHSDEGSIKTVIRKAAARAFATKAEDDRDVTYTLPITFEAIELVRVGSTAGHHTTLARLDLDTQRLSFANHFPGRRCSHHHKRSRPPGKVTSRASKHQKLGD